MIDIYRWEHDDCTIGRLTLGAFHCLTLELPWVGNQPDISCIPKGIYDYYSKISNLNGHVLELADVYGRRYIQIHSGNFTRNTQGCILVGDGVKWLDDDSILDVTNSGLTLSRLLQRAGTAGKIKIH